MESGIITFFFPKNIKSNTTWLDTDKTWIRCSVQNNTDAICKIISIKAQAILASFLDQNNAEDFLATPLPEMTISKLINSNAAIKKIEQPYSSFGGSVKETEEQFFKKVSERLRHKGLAINIWDYERIVLEAFPKIYKVICLNHTRIMNMDDDKKMLNELSPGHVLIVTVPDLKNRNAINPITPYTSLSTLSKIKQFLQNRISPCVQLEVVNPLFESVQVKFEVEFTEGKEFIMHARLLNEDIMRFLSPWAFENSSKKEISFGGSISKSVILNFIEELPYVDFLTNFEMNQFTGSDLPNLTEIEEAKASNARSILVSHEQHIIQPTTICK